MLRCPSLSFSLQSIKASAGATQFRGPPNPCIPSDLTKPETTHEPVCLSPPRVLSQFSTHAVEFQGPSLLLLPHHRQGQVDDSPPESILRVCFPALLLGPPALHQAPQKQS